MLTSVASMRRLRRRLWAPIGSCGDLICAPPPPPPPSGFSSWILGSDGYPNPLAYPNCWLWVTPTTGVTVSGTNVTYWFDQTTNHNDITNFYPTAPQYPGGTVGSTGVQGVDFTGTNCGGYTTSSTVFSPFSWFAVVKPTGSGSTLTSTWLVTADDYVQPAVYINGSNKWEMAVNQAHSPGVINGGPTITAGTTYLVGIQMSGSGAGLLQVNGTTVATGTFTPPTGIGGSPVYLMNYGNGNPMAGVLGDVALYTSFITGTSLVSLNRYFGLKYGIVVP